MILSRLRNRSRGHDSRIRIANLAQNAKSMIQGSPTDLELRSATTAGRKDISTKIVPRSRELCVIIVSSQGTLLRTN